VAEQTSLALSGELQASPNVISLELRELREDLLFGHAAGKILQYVLYRDPGIANTRLPTSPARIDYDAFKQIHLNTLPLPSRQLK